MATVTEIQAAVQLAAGESAITPSQSFASGAILSFANQITRMIEAELIKRESPLLVVESTVAIASGATYGTLPTDFFAVAGDEAIWTSGSPDYYLKAQSRNWLVKQDSAGSRHEGYAVSFGTSGSTATLHVAPPVNASSTLGILYYRRNTALTTMSGTVPFAGLFDELYINAVKMLAENAIEGQTNFEQRLTAAVEDAVYLAAGQNDPRPTQVGNVNDWDGDEA